MAAKHMLNCHDFHSVLLSKTKTGNQVAVGLHITLLQICKKPPSLTYHLEQTTPGMMILVVICKMFVELVNPLRKEGNLNLR